MPGGGCELGQVRWLPRLSGYQRGQSEGIVFSSSSTCPSWQDPLHSNCGYESLGLSHYLKCLLLHTSASLNSSFNLEDLQSFIPLRVRSQQHAVWEKHVLLLSIYVLACKLFWAGTHFMCHVPCARLPSFIRLMLQKSGSTTPSEINM